MITLTHYLTLSAMLFSLSVAGIFLNRKNVILLLMCIELMLLAVNFNFIAFSRYLGDLSGQVFWEPLIKVIDWALTLAPAVVEEASADGQAVSA